MARAAAEHSDLLLTGRNDWRNAAFALHSPDGTGTSATVGSGAPKRGVPSVFQVNGWARVVRRVSQTPLAALLA